MFGFKIMVVREKPAALASHAARLHLHRLMDGVHDREQAIENRVDDPSDAGAMACFPSDAELEEATERCERLSFRAYCAHQPRLAWRVFGIFVIDPDRIKSRCKLFFRVAL